MHATPSVTIGRIAATHGRFNRIRHVASICTRNTVLWPTRVSVFVRSGGLRVSMRIIVPKLVKIGRTVGEIWLFNGLQDCGRPPSSNL